MTTNFPCSCGRTFKTQRGWTNHVTAQRNAMAHQAPKPLPAHISITEAEYATGFGGRFDASRMTRLTCNVCGGTGTLGAYGARLAEYLSLNPWHADCAE